MARLGRGRANQATVVRNRVIVASTTTVGKTLEVIWDVRAPVSKSIQTVWNVYTVMAKNLDILWDIHTPVANNLDLLWNIHASVAKSLQAVWDVHALANKQLDMIWNVRAAVSKNLQTLWDVHAAVAKNLEVLWNIYTVTSKNLDIQWVVRTSAAKNLELLWDIHSKIGKALVLLWNIEGEDADTLPGIPLPIAREYGPYVEAFNAIIAPTTRITRRADIYESDGVTPWMLDAPLLTGSVSIDQTRAERRILDITFENIDGLLNHNPEGFWYDKIIKPYRGVRTADGIFEIPLGEFLIDSISSPRFPHTTTAKCRDYVKKLSGTNSSKFSSATTFTVGMGVDEVIKAVALNGGITKFRIPNTSWLLTRDFTFEANTERWRAIDEILKAYGYECFFDSEGFLVMQEFQDPVYSPVNFTFHGGSLGTLIDYDKSSNDSRLFNHVVVTGGASDILPIQAEARNDHPLSPTRIERIGDRIYPYKSEFITSYEQARDVALKFLKIFALEEFEISFETLVIPWLDAGNIIGFEDPNPETGVPERFLLSNLTIPLSLESMKATGKRLAIVGEAVV